MTSRFALVIASALLIGSAGAAMAADMPVKAPPPPVLVDSWTGFYVGLNGGGTWGSEHSTAAPADPGTTAFFSPCFTAGACPRDYSRGNTGSGGEAGGQLGYNWQVNSVVLGAETDIQWTNVRSTAAVALANTGTGFVPFNGAASSKLEWFGTTRGRLGFLAQPNLLLYGTVGLAYGSLANSFTANFPATGQLISGSNTDTRIGWAAGAGIEWKVYRGWIVGVEYLHTELDSRSFNATGFGSAGCTAANCNLVITDRFRTDTVRARVSYEFNGPVLAKY
jgi:outer membrane immunogenic protein